MNSIINLRYLTNFFWKLLTFILAILTQTDHIYIYTGQMNLVENVWKVWRLVGRGGRPISYPSSLVLVLQKDHSWLIWSCELFDSKQIKYCVKMLVCKKLLIRICWFRQIPRYKVFGTEIHEGLIFHIFSSDLD